MEIIPAVETAKLIRSQLRKEFAGSKFSVTTEKSTNTRIINVKWQDGVAYDKVEKILEQFRGRKYDGMTDTTIFTGTKWQGKEVCFNTLIDSKRTTTQGFSNRILQYLKDKYSEKANSLIIIGDLNSSNFTVENSDHEWLLIEANKIKNESNHDRVFYWELEKGEIIIEEQLKADQEYLETLEAPEQHCAYIDLKTKKFHVECISPRFLTTDYYFYQGNIKVGNYPNWYDLPAFESRDVVWEFQVRYFKLNDLKIMTLQELKAAINHKEEASCDCKVVSINKYAQSINSLESCYKFWLQKQIEKNQLSEIIDFEAWKYFYDSEKIKDNYLEFVQKCVDEKWTENIMSFFDWLMYLFEED